MNKTTLKHNIRRILMLIAMMSLTLSANSQTCLLTLKDSTQYRGYIFKQSPGESIEFAITDDNTSKHIKWSDIYSIGKTLRGENAKFGYDDEITLRDERKMVGQIIYIIAICFNCVYKIVKSIERHDIGCVNVDNGR